MMFERSNQVTNVGKVQFTKLVLNLLQLFTFEKLHFTIAMIIKYMPSQKGLCWHSGKSQTPSGQVCDRPPLQSTF